MHMRTNAIHGGVYTDTMYNSITTPIYPASTFYFNGFQNPGPYDYSRSGNPTRTALAENLAALEGGAAASITCSGMAAVSSAMQLFKPGDSLIAGNDIYGGTYRLFHTVLQNAGIKVHFVDMRDSANVLNAIDPSTRGLWIETPSNPLLNVIDLRAMIQIARDNKLLTLVDNTFMSPYFQRPLEMGADVVVHSTTKYINGHSDVVGGAIITRDDELGGKIAFIVNATGTACSPFDAFLVLRGVKTLPLRMEAHQHNAMNLAEYLASNSKIRQVYYPGLPQHPQHELAKQQMNGFGGMLSFEFQEDVVDLKQFFHKLHVFRLAESLGGIESLIEHPWTMSHAGMPEESRRIAGLTEQSIRISAGLEHPDDLIADLEQAIG